MECCVLGSSSLSPLGTLAYHSSVDRLNGDRLMPGMVEDEWYVVRFTGEFSKSMYEYAMRQSFLGKGREMTTQWHSARNAIKFRNGMVIYPRNYGTRRPVRVVP